MQLGPVSLNITLDTKQYYAIGFLLNSPATRRSTDRDRTSWKVPGWQAIRPGLCCTPLRRRQTAADNEALSRRLPATARPYEDAVEKMGASFAAKVFRYLLDMIRTVTSIAWAVKEDVKINTSRSSRKAKLSFCNITNTVLSLRPSTSLFLLPAPVLIVGYQFFLLPISNQ